MIQAKHCDLCDYPKRSLKNGLTCGLTNKKPDFKVACSEIKFSNSFKEYLLELLNEIEQVKKNKTYVYVNFTLFGIIGLIIILGNYSRLKENFEMEFNHSSWIYFTGTLLLYVVGFLLIAIAFLKLIQYKKTLNKLKSNKREIDLILKNYNNDIETLLNSKNTSSN